MNEEVHHITLPATQASFWDRIQAAYYAFQMKVKPDVARVLEDIIRIQGDFDAEEDHYEKKLEEAKAPLDGYLRAMIDSIASMSDSWRDHFDIILPEFEGLPIESQVILVRYMFKGNRHIVRHHSFHQWMNRHADAILNSLPD